MKLLEMKKSLYRRLDELDIAIHALEEVRTRIVNEIDGLLTISETVVKTDSGVVVHFRRRDPGSHPALSEIETLGS